MLPTRSSTPTTRARSRSRNWRESGEDFIVLSYDSAGGPLQGQDGACLVRRPEARRSAISTDKGWFDVTFDHPDSPVQSSGLPGRGSAIPACRCSPARWIASTAILRRPSARRHEGQDNSCTASRRPHDVDGRDDLEGPDRPSPRRRPSITTIRANLEVDDAGRTRRSARPELAARRSCTSSRPRTVSHRRVPSNGMSQRRRRSGTTRETVAALPAGDSGRRSRLVDRGDAATRDAAQAAPDAEDAATPAFDARSMPVTTHRHRSRHVRADGPQDSTSAASHVPISGLLGREDRGPQFGSYEALPASRCARQQPHASCGSRPSARWTSMTSRCDCPHGRTTNPRTSGHNFVIWPELAQVATGSGHRRSSTPRRAAKMVVLDLDHPDIEEFVNWKVVEEQKVAALVTGSRQLNRHLNAILKACHALAERRRAVRPRPRTPTCARRSPRPAPP